MHLTSWPTPFLQQPLSIAFRGPEMHSTGSKKYVISIGYATTEAQHGALSLLEVFKPFSPLPSRLSTLAS
jgi:hypothetical protein